MGGLCSQHKTRPMQLLLLASSLFPSLSSLFEQPICWPKLLEHTQKDVWKPKKLNFTTKVVENINFIAIPTGCIPVVSPEKTAKNTRSIQRALDRTTTRSVAWLENFCHLYTPGGALISFWTHFYILLEAYTLGVRKRHILAPGIESR